MTKGRDPFVPGVSGVRPPPLAPLAPLDDDAPLSEEFIATVREGLALLDDGFPWEAHERFELCWNACGRRGVRARVMQALAKIGAAFVKERQGSAIGRATHLANARALLDDEEAARVACGVRVERVLEGVRAAERGERVEWGEVKGSSLTT